jgi:hypothetical protein
MIDSVWAIPFSLAATHGISIDFFSSSYSDASLRTVRPPKLKQGSVKRDLIRTSWDHRSHAPTPGLSQLATSFFTYQAESSSNRRLCTSFSCIYSYIYEALNLYANTGKDDLFYYHIYASVVIDKLFSHNLSNFGVMLIDPMHDDHRKLRLLRPSFPFELRGIAFYF